MERRSATIIGQDGWLHIKIIDSQQRPHWLLPSQFDPGARRDNGAKVRIEYRPFSWYVLAPRIVRLTLPLHP